MNHRQRIRTRARGRRSAAVATWTAGLGGAALATVFGATLAQQATADPGEPAPAAPPVTSSTSVVPPPQAPADAAAPPGIRPPAQPPVTGHRHHAVARSGGS
ncbi:hypothetical protein [Amycolatopsis sp. NPDC054798]